MTITKDVVIGKYVALRDEIKAISERHSAELAPYNDQMDKIEAWLLANLNQDGVDSYKTAMGTAYKSTTMSATMADKQEFLRVALAELAVVTKTPVDRVVDVVLQSGLLDIRLAKSGVKDFMETNGGQLPPGVNVEHTVKVNVRRAS